MWPAEDVAVRISAPQSGLDSWPTTATSIGVKTNNGVLEYYATFELDDILNLVVRPNKEQITKEIYENKVERWKKCWPKLKIIEW